MSFGVVEWEHGVPSVGPAVIALGVFDGVHLGHQELLRSMILHARRHEVPAVAVTFDRDPDQVVTPDRAMAQLLTLEDKIHFLGACGLDSVVVLPFCIEMARYSPEAFVHDVLMAAVRPRLVVVGSDFRFGNRASGDVATLKGLGEEAGFDVLAHDLVESGSHPVTSTRIRALVSQGDVEAATILLGRPHRVAGRVTHGRGEGSDVAVPTANVTPVRYSAVPANGVYGGWVDVDGKQVMAAISVGAPPTFPGARPALEAHLLDFEEDIYHAEVSVLFAERIRDLAEFDGVVALKEQVTRDIDHVRERLS